MEFSEDFSAEENMQIKKRKTTYYYNSGDEKQAQEYKKKNPDAELVKDDTQNHKASGLGTLTAKSTPLIPSITTKATGLSVTAQLRAAKKGVEEAQVPRKKKLEGEVTFGPTTIKKRSKK